MKSKLKVALAGNPNSGKTTIFNALTGARQHVGNYPGVTVEKKEGIRCHGEVEMQIVDLPGTYSLTAYSAEELVARNFILDDNPDVVVDIIDASNLERNLYLAVQLRELGVPLVLAFNMSDMARSRGYEFDLKKLSDALGAVIVNTVGHKSEGMNELLDAVLRTAGDNSGKTDIKKKSLKLNYGSAIEEELKKIDISIRKDPAIADKYDARWMSVKLLENDKELKEKITLKELPDQIEKSISKIENITGELPETAIAGTRYKFIADVCRESVRSTIEFKRTLSDKIDSIVTNRILGIPIFLGLMYLVFKLTFTLGDPFMGWIEGFFGWLGEAAGGLWSDGSESILKSLIIDGLIGGVGGVLVFLPNILFLFLAIAVLEDSGYMARAAFIMDRLMNKIGLHGKSFIPMLIGFGCSVPAIMATRTLENRRDRLVTMLVVPLMSCGARLPIYALIIPAFFPEMWHAPMLWIIYITGILLAIVSAKLLRSTILKGEAVPFVMELPPYRRPTIKGMLIHMWERGGLYVKKAGTIILGISILLWAMTAFPKLPENITSSFEEKRQSAELKKMNEEEKAGRLENIDKEESEAALSYSISGRIGQTIEPALRPMGFDWKIGTALIGAFAAKEVFVAQMGIVYAVGEADETSESLRDKLKENYNPLIGFCIMLFCLISAPCMATIAVTKRESNSWKWALFQLAGLTIIAYIITTLVFQIGRLLGIGM